jgi:hypothetical protein
MPNFNPAKYKSGKGKAITVQALDRPFGAPGG